MIELFESYGLWTIWIISVLIFSVMLATMPCHTVFLLPFIGLPLFWLLPLEYALPTNTIIWLATPFLYRAIMKAMSQPPTDGFRSLVGTQTEVISKSETGHSTSYLVHAQGELWSANSTDILNAGESVNIVAVKGISLVIERASGSTRGMKLTK